MAKLARPIFAFISLVALSTLVPVALSKVATAANSTSGSSYYFPLSPARIGISTCNLGVSPISTGQVETLNFESAPAYPSGCPSQGSQPITAPSGLPSSGITAVVVNVTATNTSASNGGSLSFWLSSGTEAPTSSMSFAPGETVASEITVATSSSGSAVVGATLANNDMSSIQMTIDVEGYYSSTNQSGDTYVPLPPAMVGKTDCGQPFGSFSYGGTTTGSLELNGSSSYTYNSSNHTCTLVGPSGFPTAGEAAAVVSVTVTSTLSQSSTPAGSLTVFETGTSEPSVANILFASGQRVTNQVIVPASSNGSIFFQAALDNINNNTIQIEIDVEGYFSATGGSTYMPVNPTLVASSTCNQPSGFAQLTSANPVDSLNLVSVPSLTYTNQNHTSCQTGSAVLPANANGMTAAVLDVTAIPSHGSIGALSTYPASLTGSSVVSVGYSSQSTASFTSTTNEVTVQIPQTGSSVGKIAISSSTYPTDVSVDVIGYFTSAPLANTFVPVAPTRICDTRSTSPSNQCTGKTISSNSQITVGVAGYGGVPTTGVTSVLLTATVIASSTVSCGPCYITIWPDGSEMPAASNINYQPSQVISNQVSVMISPYINGQGGSIDVYAASGPVDIAIDVAGYYTPSGGASFVPVTPSRICDTRSGNSTQCVGKSLSANTAYVVKVDGQGAIPTSGVVAVVAKITAIDATSSGYLKVWPDGSPVPQTTSNLNYISGSNNYSNNQVTVGVSPYLNGSGGSVDLWENSGTLDVLIDVKGYYSSSGGVDTYTPIQPVRLANTSCNSPSGLPSGFSKLTSSNPGPESLPLFEAPVYDTQCSSSLAYGSSGLPARGISAVVLNVATINGTSAAGWLNVYDSSSGNDISTVSDINYTGVSGSNTVVASLITVQVGASGNIGFATSQSSPSLDIVVDLAGYFMAPAGNTYTPVIPAQIGNSLCGSSGMPSGFGTLSTANSSEPLAIDGAFSYGSGTSCTKSSSPVLPATGITAVTLNVITSVPASTSKGSLVLVPSSGTGNDVALSYPANTTSSAILVNNQVTVEVGSGGSIAVSATAVPLNVIVDVVGYFSSSGGLNYVPLNPERIATSDNLSCYSASEEPSGFAPLGSGTSESLDLSGSPAVYDPSSCNKLGASGLPKTGVAGVVLSVAATNTSSGAAGVLNVYPTTDNGVSGSAPPDATLNVMPGQSASSEISLPTQESTSVSSISCATTQFCEAVDALGNVIKFNGTSWSTPSKIDTNGGLTSVSCPSSGFCETVDTSGNAVSYNGNSWSSPLSIDSSRHLVAAACASATYCLAVDSSGYDVSWNGSSWSTPVSKDPFFPFTGVSCASGSTSCVLVDSAGNVYMTSSSTWYLNELPGPATGVSCYSTSSCMALDSDGNYSYWNGSSWTGGATQTGEQFTSISCYSSTACVASDVNGDAIAANYQSGAWKWVAQSNIDTTGSLTSLSCVSASFCVSVDSQGSELQFNGSSWSQPTPIDSPRKIVFAVPSGSSTLEVSVDIDGYFTTSHAGSEFVSVVPSEIASTSSSSCSSPSPSTFYNLAYSDNLDSAGNSNGSYVNLEDTLNLAGAQSIGSTCASNGASGLPETGMTSVVLNVTATTGATSNGAQVAIYPSEPGVPTNSDITLPAGGGTATKQVTVQTSSSGQVIVGAKLPQNALQAISCASGTTSCVAVDQSGSSVVWNGSSWSKPIPTDKAGALNAVSCYSASYCIAMGATGDGFKWDGTNWYVWTSSGWVSLTLNPTPLQVDTNGNVQSVSCTSTTFCMTVDSGGYEVTWNGTTWSSPTSIDSTGNLTSVSCPSITFCMAVDKSYNYITWSTSGWSTPKSVTGASSAILTLSCPNSATCVAGDASGNYYWWSSPSWGSSGEKLDSSSADINSISCVSTTACFAVAGDGTSYSITGASTRSEIGSTPIDNGNSLAAISCASTTNCFAVDGARGNVLEYSGSPTPSWSGPTAVDITQVQVVVDVVGYYLGNVGSALGTVAGLAEPTSWSGSVATGAALGSPTGVGSDANGNIYVSDASDNVVWQINRAGLISSYAGTFGASGNSGDKGPATLANLNSPGGIAVDKSGNVLISDTGNSTIRVVPSSGKNYFGTSMTAGDIYTVAGGGSTSGCGTSGVSATSVKLSSPNGVAVDSSGNIYIADSGDNCIRMVPNVSGTYFGTSMTAGDIYTVAGGGSTSGCGTSGVSATSVKLSSPNGIAVDSSGNIYIADSGDNCIRMVPNVSGTYFGTSMTAGDIYTVAGSGTAGFGGDGGSPLSAEMDAPYGIAIDLNGNLVVADAGNCRLRLISSNLISTIGGAGVCGEETRSGNAEMASIEPSQVAVTNSGDLLFSDTATQLVQKISGALNEVPYSANYPVSYSNVNVSPISNSGTAVSTSEQDAYDQYGYNSIQDGTTYYSLMNGDPNTYVDLPNGQIGWLYNAPGSGPVTPAHTHNSQTTTYSANVLIVQDGPGSPVVTIHHPCFHLCNS